MTAPARRLTLLSLSAATFFIVSGGPYGLEDVVAGHGYAGALLLLLLLPLVWGLPVALLVGELGSALPETGGYYPWVRRALGPFWGLQEAWLSLAVTIVDLAIYPALLVAYLAQLWPALGSLELGTAGWGVAVGMIALCAAWNALGIRAVGVGSEWLAALILAPFAAVVVLALLSLPGGGLVRAAGSLRAAPPAAGGGAWVAGLLACMWNYMGWDNASTFAGEVESPQRTYPLAMLLTMAAVTACYLLPVLAATATGLPAAAWTAGTWVEVARALGGEPLAWLVVTGGAVTGVGMFNAILLSWTRLPVALAADGLLPSAFARRSARSGAPVPSILLGALVCAALVGLGLHRLFAIDVLIYGAALLLEFAALVALRLREPDLPRPFRVPGGLAGVLLVSAAPAALLGVAAWTARAEPAGLGLSALEATGLVVAAGLAWYLAAGRPARRPAAGR
ncbi:MAG TPA: APC family permease [Anaeromyxobacteraceae bacterium]|nr:APC family permease [Anaeromyxobacteraceae bacterium]